MKKFYTESTVIPVEWDTTSSPTIVYHNYNVEEVLATEESPKRYVYDQDQYSREEYREYLMQDTVYRLEAAENAILALMDGGNV